MSQFYFRLPALNELTTSQRSAINQAKPIALSGAAGTGKSVVSLYRHLSAPNSQLLTYTKTLAMYLKKCCPTDNIGAAQRICSIFQFIWKYENAPTRSEIIVDEAQDLRYAYVRGRNLTYKETDEQGEQLPQLHIYRDFFSKKYGKVSYGADDAQNLRGEAGITRKELEEIYPENVKCPLSRNFRNTRKILRLAQVAFPQANLTDRLIEKCEKEGEQPVLYIVDYDINDILSLVEAWTEKDQNVAILCAWQEDVRRYHECVSEKFPEATYYCSDKDGTMELSNIHVTTFKSAKGLEFDTVIIPNFHLAFDELGCNYQVDWKDYYVGVTRAKTNLFLLSERELFFLSGYVTVNRMQLTEFDDDFLNEQPIQLAEGSIYADDLPF